ncbi:hypothetical protein SAMN05421730_10733, partial [Anaerobium acetethylicum]
TNMYLENYTLKYSKIENNRKIIERHPRALRKQSKNAEITSKQTAGDCWL